MTFEALMLIAPPVLVHITAACLALVLGPFALLRRSRDIWHKVFGYGWVLAMVVTAISSFWITGFQVIGPYSPIHGLSLFVLYGLAAAIWQVRRGRVDAHRATMQGLYVYAVCITGLFTLIPGRLMNTLVLGGADGWLVMTALIVTGVGVIFIHRRGVLPLGKVKALF